MIRILIFIFCTFSFSVSRSEIVEKIVAIVNNEIITETDLRSFSNKLEKTEFIDDLLLFGKTTTDLKKSKSDQLDYLINERLLQSEVKRLNLSVTIERVEQEIRDIGRKNGMNRTDLLATIKQQGLSVSEYQDFVKNRVERQSLIEAEITSKIRVTDEDVMAQYGRLYPNSTTGVYEYSISHILINPKKGGLEASLERANNVVKKLKAGESFEVLAEQHSEDPNFATGGVLGTFKAGEFAKEMEDAVSKINPGETTDVVKSKGGLHIIKLLSKKIVADPRYEREKEKIRNVLFEKSFQKNFKTWLESKKDDSFIKINK